MGYVNRSRGGRHRAAVRCPINALRLALGLGGKANEHFISIEFDSAATNRRLAGVSKLVNLSLSVHLINGQSA